MKFPSFRKSAGACPSGFSLVEVVLAVGVVSFAFVAIMGLIPAGIHQFRQAIDNSVCTQIGQRVILDCEQTDFNTLIDYSNTLSNQGGAFPFYFRAPTLQASNSSTGSNPGQCIRYFDEEGNEIIPANNYTPSPAESKNIVYWVNTRIGISTQIPTALTSTVHFSQDIASVLVQVVFNPGQIALQTQTYSQGNPQSCMVTNTSNQTSNGNVAPPLEIRNYTAQIGRNF